MWLFCEFKKENRLLKFFLLLDLSPQYLNMVISNILHLNLSLPSVLCVSSLKESSIKWLYLLTVHGSSDNSYFLICRSFNWVKQCFLGMFWALFPSSIRRCSWSLKAGWQHLPGSWAVWSSVLAHSISQAHGIQACASFPSFCFSAPTWAI